jgi:hypothetical protein
MDAVKSQLSEELLVADFKLLRPLVPGLAVEGQGGISFIQLIS